MLQEIVEYIGRYDKFVVIGHVAPDGDCIGAQLALTLFLQRLGKQAQAASVGPFNKNEVKASEDLFAREPAFDWPECAVFIVDCSTFERTGFEPFGVDVRTIDHHSNVEANCVSGYVDATSPSTTMLIQQLIESYNIGISQEEAKWIFLGFATDTGFFQHLRGGSGKYFRQVATLVDLDASPGDTFALLEGGYSLRDRQYLGYLMANSQSFLGDRVVVIEDTGMNDNLPNPTRDSAMLYRLLLSAEATEVVVVMRGDSEQVTVGLRSKNSVNVGVIAQYFGGGGHVKASGCTIKLSDFSINKIKEFIVSEIALQLNG
jgi:bifunctional oligoribonuclease and PAP phosphatase NrnA